MPYIGKSPANVPVTADDIPNNSITAAKIVDNSITISDVGPNAVGTSEIVNDAVTTDKLNLISTSSVPSIEAKSDGTTDGYIQLNCTANSHGIKLKSPPHSAGASYTLTFPNDDGNANQKLTTNGSGVLTWTADVNTTYSVQDGELSQNNFTNADHTKLNAIEASATADQTNSEIKAAVEAASDSNTFTDADHSKLNAVAASANNYVHPNHSGEVTSTADGATVIADNIVDEANFKVSNNPTNGYFLSAQSGNTGGLTWATAGSTSASDLTSGTLPIARIADDAITVDKLANSINSAIAANTSKTGITSSQATAITAALPKAGGTMTGHLLFGDNKYLRIGAANDLDIFHDGSNSYINETGTGDLIISGSNNVRIKSAGGEDMIIANADNAVTLYYNNAAKLATSATGVTVTGAIGGATNLGKVLQVVAGSASGTTTVSNTSDTYISHIVTIQPSATSSKVLVFLDIGYDTENANGYGFTAKLSIDNGSNYLWEAGSNGYANNNAGGSMTSHYSTQNYTVLHAPSSTSSLSYKVYVELRTGTVRFNGHAKSRLYAMEIGA